MRIASAALRLIRLLPLLGGVGAAGDHVGQRSAVAGCIACVYDASRPALKGAARPSGGGGWVPRDAGQSPMAAAFGLARVNRDITCAG